MGEVPDEGFETVVLAADTPNTWKDKIEHSVKNDNTAPERRTDNLM